MDALAIVTHVQTHEELLRFRRDKLFRCWFHHQVEEGMVPDTLTEAGMVRGVHAQLVGALYYPFVGNGYGQADADIELERKRLTLEGPTKSEDVERTRHVLERLQNTCRKYGFPMPSQPSLAGDHPDWSRPQTKLLRHLGILYYDYEDDKMNGWVKDLLTSPGMTAAHILHAFTHDGWHLVNTYKDPEEDGFDEGQDLEKEIAPLDMNSVLA